MRREKTYVVTPQDGRVKAVVNGRRVLVAVPGDEVPYHKALEWGLVEPEESEPAEPEPVAEKRPAPKSKKARGPKKAEEPKKTEGPKLSSYPTKPDKKS